MRTHGVVEYLPRKRIFVVKVEPHVSLRLKRVFAKVDKSDLGVLQLSATPENARDLAWFMRRYPLFDATGNVLRVLAADHIEQMSVVEAMRAGTLEVPPFDLALPLREYQRQAATLALRVGGLLLADDVGLGKQHPVDTLVLTPTGYRPIGALRVGDHVIGSTGAPVAVTGVFPQGVKPSYRVHLSDSSSVEAGPDHLWTIGYYLCGPKVDGERRKQMRWLTLTTEQLRQRPAIRQQWANGSTAATSHKSSEALCKPRQKMRLFVPMLSAPVQFERATMLPIPAYVAGQMIANGSLAHGSCSVTVNSEDWVSIRNRIEATGVRIGAVNVYGGATRFGIFGMTPAVRALELDVLSGEKHVPTCYLRAPVADRIALLQGLMDGDGSVSSERNRVNYHTTSARLAGDFVELVEQLGGVATPRRYDRSAEGKPVEWSIRVRMPSSIRPFSTPRKCARYNPGSQRKEPTRSVASVAYVRDVESVCIAVDAPDRLYVTEHAILTHNTASTIGTFTDARVLPMVIVCYPALCKQWQDEITRFAPHLRTHIVRSVAPYDLRIAGRGKTVEMPHVIIISYHKLSGWSETLRKLPVRGVGFDEVQELRTGPPTAKYKAARYISRGPNVRLRLGTSATPIHNLGSEFFNVLECLRPGALGTKAEFLREWCGSVGDVVAAAEDEHGDVDAGPGGSNLSKSKSSKSLPITQPKAFGAYLRAEGLMLKRTRKEVGRELPGCQHIIHTVEADPEELDRVAGKCADLARLILSRPDGGMTSEEKKERGLASVQLSSELRRATGVAKAPFVATFVRMLVETGEKVVVFGWHRRCYDIWLEALKDFRPVLYTGSETAKQKDEAKRAFVDGKTPVIIISNRAGAGLDGLQFAARVCVHAELDWSPAVREQNTGRIFRDGQRDPVTSYTLVTEMGSDPVISDLLGLKQQQLDGVRNPGSNLVEELQVDPNHIRKLAEGYLRQRRHAPKIHHEEVTHG